MTNFRNYQRLELDLPAQLLIFQGDNAQGKSNLLEAIYLLATTRSLRTANEGELIGWSAGEIPVARLVAEVQRVRGVLQVEMVLRGEKSQFLSQGEQTSVLRSGVSTVQKRIRVNGIVRRAGELIGEVNAVFLSPQDIDLVAGAPALRRRYLDILNSQVDPRYLRHLQHYHRVLFQRNHLLRLIQEHRGRADQLEFWDTELVEAGSYLIAQRRQALAELSSEGEVIHREIIGEDEKLEIVYLPGAGRGSWEREALKQEFREALERGREKEVTQGITLVGPHRDEVRFRLQGMDMGVYGSRGQQRTIALALKLAEVKLFRTRTRELPLLLLDEVFSELDRRRRFYLQQFLLSCEQVLLTTTDLERFEPAFLNRAKLFCIKQGKVEAVLT